MSILLPIPSFDHSNSGIVVALKIQRPPVTPRKTGGDLPTAARALFRASRGNPDRGFQPRPQHGGGTDPERLRNSTMDRPIRMRRTPNRLCVHGTTWKH